MSENACMFYNQRDRLPTFRPNKAFEMEDWEQKK